eukprot:gene6745-365_t
MPKKGLGIRKSIHGKKSKSSPAPAPPVTFPPKISADRIPIVKKDGRQNSSRFRSTNKTELTKLPPLMSANQKDRPGLFVQKVRQCCAVFDFTESLSDLKSKEIKRSALNELFEFLKDGSQPLQPDFYEEIVNMFSMNLFRTLSPPADPNAALFDPEEDEPTLEAAWPHLELVYGVFLRFIETRDFEVTLAKPLINQKFIFNLLSLFDSEDPRERDCLKTTLHRIYGKFLSLRPYIRRNIYNIFHQFIYETEHHNGIPELLEIFGSIINGFATPLKPEHTRFLMKLLIPLHKPKSMSAYHPQLSYCIVQFLEKDPKLTEPVINGLFRFWPNLNSPKEVLMLNELEEILDVIEPDQFSIVQLLTMNLCCNQTVPHQKRLFKQLSNCLTSFHFQVAERAIYFFNNEYLISLIAENPKELIPLVFPALYQSSQTHWNRAINNLVFNTFHILMQIDNDVYQQCHEQQKELQNKRTEERKKQQSNWETLEAKARANPISNFVELKKPQSYDAADSKDVHGPVRMAGEPPSMQSGMRRKSVLPYHEATLQALSSYTGHSLDSTASK